MLFATNPNRKGYSFKLDKCMIKPIQGLEDIYQTDFFNPVRTGVDFVAQEI